LIQIISASIAHAYLRETKDQIMLGKLTMPEIEKLLSREVVGRIGCSDGNMVYMVPISYTYDGKYIYCHSHEGLKVNIMRKNPRVCFEVDHMQNMANWQTVVAQGTFEELTEPALRAQALRKLHERILPMIASETVRLSADWPFAPPEINQIEGITFRILLTEKTGRFEKTVTTAQTFFGI
jgi:nitroimidazol reductase NimA-like FMN-containing flavoprotein (pyridoxamine 5'-phosphate oxidase superfamily)